MSNHPVHSCDRHSFAHRSTRIFPTPDWLSEDSEIFLFFLVYCTVAVLYKTASTLSPTELGDVGTRLTITAMAAKREVIKFPWSWRLEQNLESWKYLAEGRGA